jgi:hypothetical protein
VAYCKGGGREEKCIQKLVGKAKGKRSCRRPRLRWVDNVENGVIEIGQEIYGLNSTTSI